MRKSGFRTAAAVFTLAFATVGSGCAGMGARVSPQAAGAHLTVMALNMANNRAEIAEGQLALTNAASPAVREFAQRMVTEHTANMQRQQQVMQQMGITDEMLMMLPVTAQMESNHQQAMQILSPARGPAFDVAYMERQAGIHRYALESIDALTRAADAPDASGGTTLDMQAPRRLNAAQAAALGQESRAMIAEHEQLAQQVRTSLGGAM